MVEKGLGSALILEKLVCVDENSLLSFKPVYPKNIVKLNLVWKKDYPLSKTAEKFVEALEKEMSKKMILRALFCLQSK